MTRGFSSGEYTNFLSFPLALMAAQMPYVSAGVAGPEISDRNPCRGGSDDRFVVKMEGLGEYLYVGKTLTRR